MHGTQAAPKAWTQSTARTSSQHASNALKQSAHVTGGKCSGGSSGTESDIEMDAMSEVDKQDDPIQVPLLTRIHRDGDGRSSSVKTWSVSSVRPQRESS